MCRQFSGLVADEVIKTNAKSPEAKLAVYEEEDYASYLSGETIDNEGHITKGIWRAMLEDESVLKSFLLYLDQLFRDGEIETENPERISDSINIAMTTLKGYTICVQQMTDFSIEKALAFIEHNSAFGDIVASGLREFFGLELEPEVEVEMIYQEPSHLRIHRAED